jgi:hypothetical protein
MSLHGAISQEAVTLVGFVLQPNWNTQHIGKRRAAICALSPTAACTIRGPGATGLTVPGPLKNCLSKLIKYNKVWLFKIRGYEMAFFLHLSLHCFKFIIFLSKIYFILITGFLQLGFNVTELWVLLFVFFSTVNNDWISNDNGQLL